MDSNRGPIHSKSYESTALKERVLFLESVTIVLLSFFRVQGFKSYEIIVRNPSLKHRKTTRISGEYFLYRRVCIVSRFVTRTDETLEFYRLSLSGTVYEKTPLSYFKKRVNSMGTCYYFCY
jgi:hypothetical protein